LEKKGYRVTWLGVDENGALDLASLRSALTDDTALVSIMWANNETGVVFPIEEIGAIVRSKGIPFHVDAVQAAGKLPIKVKICRSIYLRSQAINFMPRRESARLYVRRGIDISAVHDRRASGAQSPRRNGKCRRQSSAWAKQRRSPLVA
jgi:cysteine desulfurase